MAHVWVVFVPLLQARSKAVAKFLQIKSKQNSMTDTEALLAEKGFTKKLWLGETGACSWNGRNCFSQNFSTSASESRWPLIITCRMAT